MSTLVALLTVVITYNVLIVVEKKKIKGTEEYD